MVGALGDGVQGIRVGERVVALTRFGGYAESVCAPERMTMPIPDTLGWAEAAALPVNYLTAWFCINTMGHLQKGERVLVQIGAGGVGVAALQLALDAGAETFATTGSDTKVRFLEEMGVHHAINYNQEDFAAAVRQATGDSGLDLVLDGVGGKTLAKGYELLAPLGRVISYGLSSAVTGERPNRLRAALAWWRTPRFNPIEMIGRNVGVFGFHLGLLRGKEHVGAEAFARLLEMVEAGRLRPVVAATFPLDAEGAAAAHRYLHERRNIGKVLLTRGADNVKADDG